jgi:50S ribosome-binding GTPase
MVEWLAASLLLLKHKEDIRGLVGGGFSNLLGRRTSIAITGMQGVGKTVLLDHLTGKPYAMKRKTVIYNYILPQQSQKHEESKAKSKGKKIILTTVPGQDAEPRHVALDRLFQSKQPVEGVIHVVANGYARVRSETARRVMARELKIDSIDKFRAFQLEKELADLGDTCEAIRAGHKRRHAPKWMIVAVDQADLYQDTISDVRDFYSPESNSMFAKRLKELKTQVGTDFFRWDHTIPVSASLDPFEWNGSRVDPQITAEGRDAYLVQFFEILKSYCS